MSWRENEQFAEDVEKEEYNSKVNKNWKYVAKTDSKSMWKMIDYKERNENEIKSHTIRAESY